MSPEPSNCQIPQDRRATGAVLVHGGQLTGARELVPLVREASRLQIWRGLAAIAFDWAVIIGCFAAALSFPNVLVWVVAALVISGRQHALLVLMHEATHYRVLPNHAWNDRISNWFLAWPLVVTTEGFRRDHLPHHYYMFTEKDSEWSRKQKRPEFQFPFSRWQFLWMLGKDVLGFSVLKMFKLLANFSGAQQPGGRAPSWQDRVERVLYYVVLSSAIIYFHLLLPVLVLWFLPAFTLLFAILRVRNVAEHSNVGMGHDFEMARSVVAPRFWERALFGPHHVGLHLVHHLYPSVPFYNLPRIHQALMDVPEYKAGALCVKTYFGWRGPSVLTDIAVQRDNEIAMLNRSNAGAPADEAGHVAGREVVHA